MRYTEQIIDGMFLYVRDFENKKIIKDNKK